MANPIQLGAFDNVPAPDVPVRSAWAQDVTSAAVHRFTSATERSTLWPTPPQGAVSYLADTGDVQVFHAGAWRDIDNRTRTSANVAFAAPWAGTGFCLAVSNVVTIHVASTRPALTANGPLSIGTVPAGYRPDYGSIHVAGAVHSDANTTAHAADVRIGTDGSIQVLGRVESCVRLSFTAAHVISG